MDTVGQMARNNAAASDGLGVRQAGSPLAPQAGRIKIDSRDIFNCALKLGGGFHRHRHAH